MAARPRDRHRRDWPTGLREPRPGYFVWRNPETGKDMPIGRVSLTQAKHEAFAAVEYLRAQKPSLVERLSGAGNTVADLLEKMPAAPNKNTAKSWRSLDKKIKAALGAHTCAGLTVKDCADVLEREVAAGRGRTAQALRSRMVAVFAKGVTLGWLDANPAEPTAAQPVKVQRGRLTLETFNAIHAKAPEVNEWLAGAMMLALVSGQDRSTVARMRRAHIGAEFLEVERGKTRVRIEIPLSLRLDAVDLTLADALAGCRSSVRSLKYDFVVHHAREFGNAPLGSGVHPDNLSHSFAAARKLAAIEDGPKAPTFHEIRSLAKRLYEAQGGVDTKALLGHMTERMSALYANPRGAEAIRVKLG